MDYKERRIKVAHIGLYKKIERWKFPIERGQAKSPSPKTIRNPLEFRKRNSNQRMI
jgi:hypothetical protein